MISSAGITDLLIDWSEGNEDAQEQLFPLVERELHQMAHRYIRSFQPGNTLQTTALINEAYIRLIDQSRVEWQNRTHFFGIAATIMRRVLLSYVRDNSRLKRGGNLSPETLTSRVETSINEKSDEILALEQALCRLYEKDERKAKIVELRYYGGLTLEEIAVFLRISPQTVSRDWSMAKAWLAREIEK